MKKLIITLLVLTMCSTVFGQSGRMVLHRLSNRTVYEREFGEGEYSLPTDKWVQYNGIYSSSGIILEGTYKETCWIGTPGYVWGKATPKIIRRTIVKEGNIGVDFVDSSAYFGLSKHILAELEKRGELEMTRPDGKVEKVKKSNSGKAFNQAKVDLILQQILADPYGTQVDGVFELKGGE